MAIADVDKRVHKANMEKSLAALGEELEKIRTGRAQVSMLDNIRVNYYGTPSPLLRWLPYQHPDAKSF